MTIVKDKNIVKSDWKMVLLLFFFAMDFDLCFRLLQCKPLFHEESI